jgi:hypothetical protein
VRASALDPTARDPSYARALVARGLRAERPARYGRGAGTVCPGPVAQYVRGRERPKGPGPSASILLSSPGGLAALAPGSGAPPRDPQFYLMKESFRGPSRRLRLRPSLRPAGLPNTKPCPPLQKNPVLDPRGTNVGAESRTVCAGRDRSAERHGGAIGMPEHLHETPE